MAHKVRPKPSDKRMCPICGGPLPKKGPGPGAPRKYCSPKCSEEANRMNVRRLHREHYDKGRKRCPTCGQTIPPEHNTVLPTVR